MGDFDLNLSTRPFRAYQLKTLLLAVALVVLIALSVAQVYGFMRYSRMAARIRGDARNAQAESDSLGRRLAELDSRLNRPEAKDKLTEIEFLNSIIARKTFSLTRVFADLEGLMPEGVHLVSLRPDFLKDGTVLLHIEVEAHTISDATQLIEALQSSSSFDDVVVTSEEKKQTGVAPGMAPAGTDVAVAFTAKYHPEKEAQ